MFDLHFHSTRSDWINSEQEILDRAKELWLEYIAITDHDKITSDDFSKLAESSWIQSCKSTEISARNYEHKKSLHLTCYTENFSNEVYEILKNTLEKKIEMIKLQVQKLKENGFFIEYTDFIDFNIARWKTIESINKYHIVEFLVQDPRNMQIISSELKSGNLQIPNILREYLKEWWRLYDKHGLKFWIVWDYEPSLEVCNEVKEKNNAILSIAHPNVTFKKWVQEFQEVLPYYVEKWINAVEINPLADKNWLKAIFEAKKRFDLILTAWSDNHLIWHMDNKHWDFGKLNPLLSQEEKTDILTKFKRKLLV